MTGTDNTPEALVHLAASEGTHLYFSGPPQALTGIIPVVNTSSEKQNIRSIRIDSKKLLATGGVPLREIPFRTRLRGGQQVNLRARLPIDLQTPPGSYDFKVTVGPRTLPATAYIPEVVDLHVEPRLISIITSTKSSSHTRTVVCENRGNVVLLSGSECEAPIFEGDSLINAVLNGLSKSDRKSVESMTKTALDELANLKIGMLVIKRKAIAISPGQKVPIELEFQLPAGLKPRRHYSVSLALYNGKLKVDIYTTNKPEPTANKHK